MLLGFEWEDSLPRSHELARRRDLHKNVACCIQRSQAPESSAAAAVHFDTQQSQKRKEADAMLFAQKWIKFSRCNRRDSDPEVRS